MNTSKDAMQTNQDSNIDSAEDVLQLTTVVDEITHGETLTDPSTKRDSTDMIECNAKSEKHNGRGKGFTPEETLFLAKAWIEQSSKGFNQRDRTMCAGIEEIFRKKYHMDRSASSLKSTWHRVARETQKFLAPRKRVKSMKISGASDDLIEDIVQEQFRKRAGRKGKDGIVVYAAPFKWISKADYLSEQDKFTDEGCKKTAKSNNANEGTKYMMGTTAKDCSGESFPVECGVANNALSTPLATKREHVEKVFSSDDDIRHNGIKRCKLEEKQCKEEARVEDTLRGIQASLAEGNNILRQETQRSEMERQDVADVELLKLLDRDSSEFKEIMADVMSRRRHRMKRYTSQN